MTMMRWLLPVLFSLVLPVISTTSTSNPIRKVVNLLQAMQKKVTKDGAEADNLYEKFMCYCKTSGGDLSASISSAKAKIPDLQSSIQAASSQKKQLEEDLKSHQSDRAAAKEALATAKAIREKEAAAYDKDLVESQVNIAAVNKATSAISEGMGSAFLQTPGAAVLKSFISKMEQVPSSDREQVLSFLSGNSEYAPASGEIVGILKQMGDEMRAAEDEMIAAEKDAVKSHSALTKAKNKEISALSKSIEEKLGRVGELGVEIATMKNDAEDTAESLEEDTKFAADLKKNCAAKTGMHEEEKNQHSAEIVALADTIKILNDDDALELFKKTLPGAGASFIQVLESSASQRAEATTILAQTQQRSGKRHLDFILLAMRGKKTGFAKIVKMIDELVATLKAEQADDDDKKEYCAVQFDQSDDKKKGLERSMSDLDTVIEEGKESIATLTEEIAALKAGVVALDKAVAEATEQRKLESTEYKDLMKSNAAAKELILFAKNRLQKFYNPKLYKAAPSFAQVAMRNSDKAAPPPPPATVAAYTKKSEESGGVMAMMDLLVQDLDKEMTVAETEEKNGKEQYEETMSDSAGKRRQDSKSLTDKEVAKADFDSAVETSGAEKKASATELMGTERYIADLHAECDWLVKYFDVRKGARADEIDALGKAKAVLSGADFSLLQSGRSGRASKFLRQV